MISKKHAIIWIAIVSVTLAFMTFMLTYFGMKNARNAAGEIYITNDQYNMLMRYYDLNKVEEIVEQYYYEEVDRGELLEGAKKGLVGALGDPYSVYYTAEEFTSLFDKLDGVYTGVGMVISLDKEDGLATVVHVYPDSPASDVEILEGDKIVAVNGESIAGMDLESAAERLRGPDGTSLSVTILREREQMVVSMTRRPVETDKASYTMLDEEIGYFNIFEFTGNCVDVFKAGMQEMQAEGAKAIIIDVRDNPGGRMTAATDICDLLLGEGTIVYTEDREGTRIVHESDKSLWDIPIAVLVNGHSASASEIMAAALQDHGRAEIIGKQTFGKGVVQEIISLPETGGGIKVTTSMYFTPNGININGVGVTPDIDVDDPVAGEDGSITKEDDLQLQKAIEVLKGQI